MSDKEITHLLIDTSPLWDAGDDFNDPSFRNLLRLSTKGDLKIFIPHIVWEERRTQLLEKIYSKVRGLSESFDALKSQSLGNILVQGLTAPTLINWKKPEIDARSKKVMFDFASNNKIEIVPLGHDHAERAWERYFNVDPPFAPGATDRVKRRKDIPDSWIFEVAIDLHGKHSGLSAVCNDGGLSDAMQSIGIRVFKNFSQVLDEIDRFLTTGVAVKPVPTQDSISISILEEGTATVPENALELVLAGMREQFKDLDTKILGYVGYLGTPSKDQLFTLLSKSGISVEIAKNATERLVIAGVITDTGNHFLSRNKGASDLAANSVEPEIIKLLDEM